MITNKKVKDLITKDLFGTKGAPTTFSYGLATAEKRAIVEVRLCFSLAQDVATGSAMVDGFAEMCKLKGEQNFKKIDSERFGGIKVESWSKIVDKKLNELYARINKFNVVDFNAFAEELKGLKISLAYGKATEAEWANESVVMANKGEVASEQLRYDEHIDFAYNLLEKVTYLVGVKNNYIEVDPHEDLEEQKVAYFETLKDEKTASVENEKC